MDFKISLIEGHPVWDALPVGKIIYYPLEKRDYRPFAQARMCANKTDFFLRLWAFETHPSPESVLMARLNFDPAHSEAFLEIRVDSMGGMTCAVREKEKKNPACVIRHFAGNAQLPGGGSGGRILGRRRQTAPPCC